MATGTMGWSPPKPDPGETATLGALLAFVRLVTGADLALAFEADDGGLAIPMAIDPPPLPPAFNLPARGFDRQEAPGTPQPAAALPLPGSVLLALGRPADKCLVLPTPVAAAPRSGVLLIWAAADGAAAPLAPLHDQAVKALGLLRQVFSQMLASQHDVRQRRLSLSLFRDVFDSVSVGIVLIDGTGRSNLINQQAADLMGLPPGRTDITAIAMRMTGLRRSCTNAATLEALYAPHQADPHYALVTLWQWGDRWLEVDTHPVAGDGRLGRVWLFQDVTERQHHAAGLERAAQSDALTGLVNRRRFNEIVTALLAQQRPLSVLMLDLDHFKEINDTHGHAAGDKVLHSVALRMCTALRNGDTVGRIGGEEFAALLPDASLDEARQIAERLRAAIAAEPIEAGDGPIPVSASIGLASPYPGETDVATVLARADKALYAAKRAGRNRVADAS